MEFRTIPDIESKTKIYEASNKGGVIRSKSIKTGEYRILSQSKTHTGYNTVSIGLVHVLVALTFLGNRPDDTYTVDHKDNTDKQNNDVDNLAWKTKSEQAYNRRKKSKTQINSMPVVATHIKTGDELLFKSHMEAALILGVHGGNISNCINKKKGFKTLNGYTWSPPDTLPDLPGEVWKIIDTTNTSTRLISNMGRIGYQFKCGYIKKIQSEDIPSERSLEELDPYPRIQIQGKKRGVHEVVWETFAGPIPYNMMVNHINHNKRDATFSNLELTNSSGNVLAARKAGRYDGTLSQERVCVMYRDDKRCVEFKSLVMARNWLLLNTKYSSVTTSHIGEVIDKERRSAYGYVWKSI